MYFVTNCVISGKKMNTTDNVVFFPYFDSHPGDPDFVYCESAALRSEFEKWHLRDRIIKKVRDFWIQWSHEKRPISILIENQNFLIVKSEIEKKISLFCLNHVFSVDFTIDAWKRFVDLMLTSEKSHINTIENDSLFWNVNTTNDNVMLQAIGIRRDSIVMPLTDWLNLQELLSTIRS
ncbi:MAG TPA: hypothetical protein VFR47_00835 [Anaerolineales bacterium]|nr:hypothetical protein [Anaerolineales bacterium]